MLIIVRQCPICWVPPHRASSSLIEPHLAPSSTIEHHRASSSIVIIEHHHRASSGIIEPMQYVEFHQRATSCPSIASSCDNEPRHHRAHPPHLDDIEPRHRIIFDPLGSLLARLLRRWCGTGAESRCGIGAEPRCGTGAELRIP